MHAGRLSAVAATSAYSLPSLGSALYRISRIFQELTDKSFTRSPPPATRTFMAQLVPRSTSFLGVHPKNTGLHLLLCDEGLVTPPVSCVQALVGVHLLGREKVVCGKSRMGLYKRGDWLVMYRLSVG